MILATVILIILAFGMYGVDGNLRRLREEVAASEIGAGEDGDDLDVGPSAAGATAMLTAAGADSPFDQDVT